MHNKSKTSGFVKPPLNVVTDPKGTVLCEVGKTLRKDGYEIKVHMINKHKSAKYNFLENLEKYIDFGRNEKSPYQLVYGGVMFHGNIDSGEIESYFESNKGCALLDPDSASNGNLIASYCDAIKLYKNHDKGNRMPFVALMRTRHVLNDAEYAVAMFPFTGKEGWECMFNKILLLACRTVAIDGLDLLNWEQYIDKELLMRIFSVADLFIPNSDSEELEDKKEEK